MSMLESLTALPQEYLSLVSGLEESSPPGSGVTAIANCLTLVQEEARGILFQHLLKVQLARRRQRGETPAPNEYHPHFPQFTEQIGRVFALPAGNTTIALDTLEQLSVVDSTVLPIVPGYEIVGLLGKGGMGIVYKARQLSLKRVVALKMIRSAADAGPEALARFRREAETIARLQHPNIVQVFEVGAAGACPFFAMEFVEGGSLADKLSSGPLSARQAARLVETLARGIQLAHSRNIVHRDLKPANVLLGSGDTPKVADFGLAKLMDEDSGKSRDGLVMGTPSYMAPEQASGFSHAAGPVADVYALGAILYECVTGRPPFKEKTVAETLERVRSNDPPPPSKLPLTTKVPLDLEMICLKCLRKEPDERYGSAEALADDLDRFLAGEPVLARPVGWRERILKWTRRRPAVASMLAVMILGVLAGVGGLVWGLENARDALDQAEKRQQAEQQKRLQEFIQRGDGLAQLGAWRDALGIYQRVVDKELPQLATPIDETERLRLRLKILRASMFLDDLVFVEQELVRLEKEPLGPLLGIWRYEKATYHLERSLRQLLKGADKLTEEPTKDEGIAVALLEKVVHDPAVPEADRLTARGVLAPTGKQALDYFERALQLDPGHPYAGLHLISVSLVMGRLERTLALIEMWQMRNPRDPNPLLHRHFILTLQKRYDEAEKTLQVFEPKQPRHGDLDADTLNAYRSLGKILRAINDQLDDGLPEDLSAKLPLLLAILQNAPAVGGLGQSGVFRLPLTPAQRQDFTRFTNVLGSLLSRQMPGLALIGLTKEMTFEKAMVQLDQNKGFLPEGLRLFFRGTLQAFQIPEHVKKKDVRQADLHRDAAAKDLEKALTEPCLFDFRRVIWLALANYKSSPGVAENKERLRAEARQHLRMAVSSGPISPTFAATVRQIAQQSGDEVLAEDLERFLSSVPTKKTR